MDTPEDLDRLAADWIALWESETAALAQDRELAEGWAAGMAWIAATARAQAAQLALLAKWVPPRERPGSAPHERPRTAPRAAPAGTAPDAGSEPQPGGADDAAALRQRVAQLELRLADLEAGRGGADRPAPRRKRDRA
jgi:hypothetical protein